MVRDTRSGHHLIYPPHCIHGAMGVHGLATYLRERQRLLSTTIVLSSELGLKKPVPIVIDGWS